MKLKLFSIAVLCVFINCLNPTAIASSIKPGNPSLSEKQSNHIKEMCKKMVRNYYYGLKSLTGANVDKDVDQNEAVDAIQQDCFRDGDVTVENNIPAISKDKLRVNSYLQSITTLSDKIGEISYDENNITLSDFYYNNGEHFYYIVASAEQKVNPEKDKEVKKTIDFYLSFDIVNNLPLKIYSIQNHENKQFDRSNIVVIVSDDAAEKTIDVTAKPYFVFDVEPTNANIAIDGKTVFNDGRKIETTAGNHTIEILASNYSDLKFEAIASDTGVQPIVRTLTRRHGYLGVNSPDNAVKDAEVYIDNNDVGNIPLSNYQLGVGAHDIEIKGSNSFDKLYHVTITDENITTLNIQASANTQVRPNIKWGEQKNEPDPPAAADVSFQVFYDELSKYGQWVEDPQYGNVWVPANVSSDFRPYYTNGHWAVTEYGNTWVSDDEWGWACYHYGRWTYNSYYNWVWVPGYEWAPAWVTWRFGDEACGWAPLSPGLSVGVSNGCPDSWWVFVEPVHLYHGGYSGYRRGGEQNVTYIRQTTIVNNIRIDNHTHYNYGPQPTDVERVTHQHVEVYRVSEAGKGRSNVNGPTIGVYRANLRGSSPYSARPAYIVQASRPVARPQEINNTNRPTFNQDIINHRIQPRQTAFESRQQPTNGQPPVNGQQSIYRQQQPGNRNGSPNEPRQQTANGSQQQAIGGTQQQQQPSNGSQQQQRVYRPQQQPANGTQQQALSGTQQPQPPVNGSQQQQSSNVSQQQSVNGPQQQPSSGSQQQPQVYHQQQPANGAPQQQPVYRQPPSTTGSTQQQQQSGNRSYQQPSNGGYQQRSARQQQQQQQQPAQQQRQQPAQQQRQQPAQQRQQPAQQRQQPAQQQQRPPPQQRQAPPPRKRN